MRDEIARGQREAEKACVKTGARPPGRAFGATYAGGNSSQFRPRRGSIPIAERCAVWANSMRLESIQEKKNTGVFVNLISYLPTMFSTLFALAAGLLLGFIQ
jgi:hypothetical protein